MDQVVQVVGALLILVGFAGQQMGRISAASRTYLVLNLAGALILTVLAFYEELWGFLLLESVWAAVSAWSLVQVMRGRPPTIAH